MDIFDFAPSDAPTSMTLMHPSTGQEMTNDDKPIVIHVHGPDSEIIRNHERAVQNRRLKIASTTGRLVLDATSVAEDQIAKTVKCIAGWENIVVGKKPLEFTPANVHMMVTQLPYLRDQVEAFHSNRGNFFRTPSL